MKHQTFPRLKGVLFRFVYQSKIRRLIFLPVSLLLKTLSIFLYLSGSILALDVLAVDKSLDLEDVGSRKVLLRVPEVLVGLFELILLCCSMSDGTLPFRMSPPPAPPKTYSSST